MSRNSWLINVNFNLFINKLTPRKINATWVFEWPVNCVWKRLAVCWGPLHALRFYVFLPISFRSALCLSFSIFYSDVFSLFPFPVFLPRNPFFLITEAKFVWARSNVRGIEGTRGGQQNHFEPWLRLYSLSLIETENESVPQIEGLEKKERSQSEWYRN